MGGRTRVTFPRGAHWQANWLANARGPPLRSLAAINGAGHYSAPSEPSSGTLCLPSANCSPLMATFGRRLSRNNGSRLGRRRLGKLLWQRPSLLHYASAPARVAVQLGCQWRARWTGLRSRLKYAPPLMARTAPLNRRWQAKPVVSAGHSLWPPPLR